MMLLILGLLVYALTASWLHRALFGVAPLTGLPGGA